MTPNLSVTAPDWFNRAIKYKYQSRFVDVDGCSIHYITWFNADNSRNCAQKPGLLFIHGGGAHANWWRFIAPFFAEFHKIAAIDLSGMGDSGAREVYQPSTWVREINAVIEDAEIGKHPILVGHSFGGLLAMKFGAENGLALSGIVIVDSPVQDPSDTPLPKPVSSHNTRPKVYLDLESALQRFRLMPEQPCENSYIIDFIGRESIKKTKEGWTWKFDFRVMGSRRFGEPYNSELKALTCPSALIYGEKSAIVSAKTVSYMASIMGKKAPIVEIPEAYHHVMLDQPLAFITALRAILDGWARDQL